MKRRSSRRHAAALAAVGLLLLTGCGGAAGTPAPAATAPQVDTTLHDALPADVLARGVLRFVTDASYAPASSFAPDGRTIVGFEPDLGAGIGAVLGVRVSFTNAAFDGLPELVTSNAADLVMSAMTDTATRERRLDFVNYFTAGTSIVVQRGNPSGVTDLASLCGLRVAAQEGTVQLEVLAHAQQHCTSPVRVTRPATNDDALLELRTGRVDAALTDFPQAVSITTEPRAGSHYQLASTVQYEPGLYGIGVARDRVALRDAVQGALHELMTSGRYTEVLRSWNVSDGGVRTATINGGGAATSSP